MASSTVTIVGNVTREPELRYTGSGLSLARIGVAVNFRRQNRQTGEWDEETSFFDVTAFGSLGENAAASLSKGSRVIVTGRLQQRSYENQQGEKRSSVEIIADEIGPSLRWAEAEIKKVERSEGGQGGGGQGGGGGGQGGYREVPNAGSGEYSNDEEPF